MRRVMLMVVMAMLSTSLMGCGLGTVPSGKVGVVTRFGAVTGDLKQPGLYFVAPFIEGVEQMDTQIHAYSAEASAASHDMQNVMTTVTLNYQLDPAFAIQTYSTLRREYEKRIIVPCVQEAVKAVTAKYEAEKLITQREAVRDGIEALLREKLSKFGLKMEQMSITNFQFSQEFAHAIEQKVVATQLALKADNDLRRIKTEAEQNIATAKGQAEAIRIQAEAIQNQGGAEYVKLKAIEKWDGTLPVWWTHSNGPLPFVGSAPGGSK